jgi:uncharacterized membrane protein YbhN (UPF0104 family)
LPRVFRNVRPRWLLVLVPIVGLFFIDILYQSVVIWKQSHVLAKANGWYLVMACINQLSIFLVLTPVMQEFYGRMGIVLKSSRAFSMLAMGLAFARIVPGGEYILWRTSLHGRRGSATATTQWSIMYITWMITGLAALFLVAQVLTLVLYPGMQAKSLVGTLRFLPLLFLFVFVVVVLTMRFERIRAILRRIAFDKFGSHSISPVGIIRDHKLGWDTLGMLTFASLATWILESFTLLLCLRSLGLQVPVVLCMFAFTFGRLFSMLPLAPSGAGQIETAAAVLLTAYNFPFGIVFSATVLYRLISYWPPLLLGAGTYLLAPGNKGAFSINGPVFASQLHKRN